MGIALWDFIWRNNIAQANTQKKEDILTDDKYYRHTQQIKSFFVFVGVGWGCI